jgi:hypothetical protein
MRVAVLLPLIAVAACRPDPGAPSYPGATGGTGDSGDAGLPQGPDPYEAGEERLGVGLYYESGLSELIEINDVDSHYYIYSDTYSETVDLQDVVEGRESAVIEHGSVGWFGGGITWDVPRDLSAWTTLNVSFRSAHASFEVLNLHLTGGGTEAILAATDYGFTADGQWHFIQIPLADFAAEGADLSAVTGPFVFIGAGGEQGDTLKIDNLYFTQD